jgi:hypothetical protein
VDSPDLLYSMSADEDLRRTARETVEALQNLHYLIREDADYPHRVKAYVDQAGEVLLRLHPHISLDVA